MDPNAIPPEVYNLLLAKAVESVPNAGFWLAVFGSAGMALRSAATHLCKMVAEGLVIADKLATKGIDVRLSITHLDGDPPAPKRKPKASEEA